MRCVVVFGFVVFAFSSFANPCIRVEDSFHQYQLCLQHGEVVFTTTHRVRYRSVLTAFILGPLDWDELSPEPARCLEEADFLQGTSDFFNTRLKYLTESLKDSTKPILESGASERGNALAHITIQLIDGWAYWLPDYVNECDQDVAPQCKSAIQHLSEIRDMWYSTSVRVRSPDDDRRKIAQLSALPIVLNTAPPKLIHSYTNAELIVVKLDRWLRLNTRR